MPKRNDQITVQMVCELYDAGHTIEAIAKSLSVSTWLVCHRMKEGGVQAKAGLLRSKGISKEKEDEIAKKYIDGEKVKDICLEFGGIDKSTVWRIVDERGIKRREAGASAKYTVNSGVWLSQTPERDYWLGMLMADGSVHDRGKKGMQFRLLVSFADVEHVNLFKEFIESSSPVYDKIVKTSKGTSHVAAIDIHDQCFCKNLVSVGCAPRKTWTAKAIPEVIDSRDFWRGYVDGDGTLGCYGPKKTRPILSAIGHANSLLPRQLFDFLERNGIKAALNQANSGNGLRCDVNGAMAVKAARLLYGECGQRLRLERKFRSYQDMEALVENKANQCFNSEISKGYSDLWTPEQKLIASMALATRRHYIARAASLVLAKQAFDESEKDSRVASQAEAEGVIL